MMTTAKTGKASSLLIVFSFYLFFLAPAVQAQYTSQHRVYDAQDSLAVLITYTYDSTGVVETRQLQSFDLQGRLTRTELYTVDEQVLFTEDISYDGYHNGRS